MSTRIQHIQPFAIYAEAPSVMAIADFKAIFEENRHRIYSIAFWMTDNEITAEEISTRVFTKTFTSSKRPSTELIEKNLIHELRELMPIGALSLQVGDVSTEPVRSNVKRIHLERAVVQVPSTERLAFLLHDVEGYTHPRISRMLGISEEESKIAVHQSRLLVRELIKDMR
jgi:RNA polymerase sigma-70 factor, ECF subfamily